MESLQSGALRTADVARAAGFSVQQIRNLEGQGVLPAAARTASGYRVYGRPHVVAARAYRALARGAGPVEAKRIMRAAHESPPRMFALLDEVHARLHAERRDLESARAAVRFIADEPIVEPVAADEMSIAELAEALGVRTSTLRHWDAMELVVPERDSVGAARKYPPAAVRDARIVHQLRLAGYGIEPLRQLMPRLRGARRWEEVAEGLAARDASILARSEALLEGAAQLRELLVLS
ncbi:MerR family transcriptional regulator [Nocardia puris]|uniref:MerR family transcriptional regulator n=1 Tax=Nocardia puris TaxID=208602 RepID=UPI0018936754|nr:MerR family transcriptional regulator [Nocardia puris]MBF6210810.1 MerR family transcriptional regulator [Nocardia puris]MBF6364405.1 MerR family transcriptional regulator [Nocardia puris]MBF6459334.1 MerR family transcriptional regulator [Nocardia puris]